MLDGVIGKSPKRGHETKVHRAYKVPDGFSTEVVVIERFTKDGGGMFYASYVGHMKSGVIHDGTLDECVAAAEAFVVERITERIADLEKHVGSLKEMLRSDFNFNELLLAPQLVHDYSTFPPRG